MTQYEKKSLELLEKINKRLAIIERAAKQLVKEDSENSAVTSEAMGNLQRRMRDRD